MAYFDSMAGIDLVHIPTKGTGDAIAELLAGRAQAVIAANVAALPFANDPRIRFLGVSSEKPSPFVPGVPPIGNTLKGYVFDSWFGLLAPAATPKDITARLNTEIVKIVKSPEFQKQMFDIGAEPIGNTQAQMAKQIADETVKFSGLAKAAKLSIE